MTDENNTRYEQAVIEVLQHYGLSIESFGRASAGSPAGMNNAMRFAKDAARDTLYALLGREPTLDELTQIPPLFEAQVQQVPLQHIAEPEDEPEF